jgi:hypothetical protein
LAGLGVQALMKANRSAKSRRPLRYRWLIPVMPLKLGVAGGAQQRPVAIIEQAGR